MQGVLWGAAMQIALLRGGYFFARTRAAMVGLQGLSGERFRGAILDEFSLRRACSASVLEEFLCFGVVAALILARPAGRYFWMAFGNAEVVSPLWAPR